MFRDRAAPIGLLAVVVSLFAWGVGSTMVSEAALPVPAPSATGVRTTLTSASANSAASADPPRISPLETVCDGKDEDGDGHVDLLIPTGKNACVTKAKGACARGWTTCLFGQTVCESPPPLPEVVDGIDNDCNGIVDDVPVAKTHARALVLGPSYLLTDARADVATVVTLLAQAGVPYDLQRPKVDWSTLVPTFGDYSLLIVPGYLEGSAISDAMRASLEDFATGGGVVVVMKPMGTPAHANPLELVGIKSSTRTKDATSLRIRPTLASAFAGINSPEERELLLAQDPKKAPMDAWVFDVGADTEIVAEAFAGNKAIGPVATRRSMAKGAIYAWGHNLASFDASRCYLNCFEPSGDVFRVFLKEALREGAQGHVFLKHPVPESADSLLLLTHDVNTEDAYQSGAWGDAGALQMAEMEKRLDVRATYNLATNYPGGEFRPEVVKKLCENGFCSVGGHSVRHLPSFRSLPYGDCQESRATYDWKKKPTVCGEVRVSLDILSKLTGEPPRAWRSPHLANPPALFDLLARHQVYFDSSFAVGDLKYNLPVDTAATPRLQHMFHQKPLHEFPISGEDGRTVSDGERTEMTLTNRSWFLDAWEYTMLRNSENTSITTILVHPARGGAGDENIRVKVDAVEQLIRVAKSHAIGVDSLVHFGDFWRARSKVTFDAKYDSVGGYTGWFEIGTEPIRGLTFELGDNVKTFDCPACGRVEIRGNRVVMRDKLSPGTRATFVAMPLVGKK